jgi:DNA polymerase-3 subunit gamma/tau
VDSILSPEEKTVPVQPVESPKPAEDELRLPPKVTSLPPTPAFPPSEKTNLPATKPRPATVSTPAPTPAMAALASPLLGSTEVERLKLNWRQVIEQAPADTRRTPALAILRSAGIRPVMVENNVVCLAFRHHIHKELIEKIENQKVTEKIISNFLGYPCRVQCILEDNHLLKEALKMGAQITDEEQK